VFLVVFFLVGAYIVNAIVNIPKEEGASKNLDTLKVQFDKSSLGQNPSFGLEAQTKMTDRKSALWPYLLLLLLL